VTPIKTDDLANAIERLVSNLDDLASSVEAGNLLTQDLAPMTEAIAALARRLGVSRDTALVEYIRHTKWQLSEVEDQLRGGDVAVMDIEADVQALVPLLLGLGALLRVVTTTPDVELSRSIGSEARPRGLVGGDRGEPA
jgi:hypothetical protein